MNIETIKELLKMSGNNVVYTLRCPSSKRFQVIRTQHLLQSVSNVLNSPYDYGEQFVEDLQQLILTIHPLPENDIPESLHQVQIQIVQKHTIDYWIAEGYTEYKKHVVAKYSLQKRLGLGNWVELLLVNGNSGKNKRNIVILGKFKDMSSYEEFVSLHYPNNIISTIVIQK